MARTYPTLVPKADLAADNLARFDEHVGRLPRPDKDWELKQFDDYLGTLPEPELPPAPEPPPDPLAAFDAHVAGLPDPLGPTWQPPETSAPEIGTTGVTGGQTAESELTTAGGSESRALRQGLDTAGQVAGAMGQALWPWDEQGNIKRAELNPNDPIEAALNAFPPVAAIGSVAKPAARAIGKGLKAAAEVAPSGTVQGLVGEGQAAVVKTASVTSLRQPTLNDVQRNLLRDFTLVPTGSPRAAGGEVVAGAPHLTQIVQPDISALVGQRPLYHETSAASAAHLLQRERVMQVSNVHMFTSDNPDLALGQAGKGIVLEFNPNLVNGFENRSKPGLAFTSEAGQGSEYVIDRVLKAAVEAVHFRTQRALVAAQGKPDFSRFDFAAAEPSTLGFRVPRKGTPTSPAKLPMGGLVGQAPEGAPSVSDALLSGMGRGAVAGAVQQQQENPGATPIGRIQAAAQGALLSGGRGVAGRVAPGAGLRIGQMAARAAEEGASNTGLTRAAGQVPATIPEIRTGAGGGRLPPPGEPPTPALPPGGGNEIPPYRNPADRLEDLLNTKTAEQPKGAGIFDDIANFLKVFRRPSAEEAGSKAEATERLVRYDGEVARAIPREVGMQLRELRGEFAEAAGVRQDVATGAWSRAKATEEPVKADAFVDQRQKTALTLSLDDFAGEDVSVFLGELSPYVRLFRDKVRARFDALGDLLVEKGILDPEDRKGNYISHLWALAEEGNPERAGRFTAEGIALPRAYFEKARTFKTFEEGINAGYVPRTLDPLDLLEHFEIAARRRIAGAELIDDIRHTNPDAIVFHTPGTLLPAGYTQIDHPFFRPQLAFGETAGALPAGPAGALSTDVRPNITVRRPEWVVRKEIAPLFNALFAPGKLRQMSVAKQALQVSAALKRSVLGAPLLLDLNMLGFESKALAYSVGAGQAKDIVRGAIRTLGRPDLHDASLKQAVKIGGQVQRRSEWYRNLDEAGLTGDTYVSEVVRSLGAETPLSILGRVIPKYEKMQNIGEAMQFQDLIPKMKYEAALYLVGQKVKDGMAVEQAVKIAANDMNKAMGGLNRIQLGRSQDVKDALNFFLLSPDWAESRIRHFASVFQPGPRGATARRAFTRITAVGIGSVVVGEAMYGGLNGKSPESVTQSIAGRLSPMRKDEDGKLQVNPDFMTFRLPNGQRTSVLTWELDGLKLMMGIGAYAAGDSETGDVLAGRYAKARFGIAPRLALDIVRNQDWKEQPIAKSDNPWIRVAEFVAAEAGSLAFPANFQTFGQVGQGLQGPLGAGLTVSGLGRATAKQEMPDALRRMLRANGLDDARVGALYELPPAERARALNVPEIKEFMDSRKAEIDVGRAVERSNQRAEANVAALPGATRKLLASVGIQRIGDVGDRIDNALLSKHEQARYQRLANEYLEDEIARLQDRVAWDRWSKEERREQVLAAISRGRARAAKEIERDIPSYERQERRPAASPQGR